MKHVKLFEDFSMGSQMNFSPEDISKPGDTVFCWNFEDGWEVALLDAENSEKMYSYLKSRMRDLVTEEIEASSKPGIAFVTAGIPYDISVNFVGPDFDYSDVSYLISSDGVEDNPNENAVDSSCIFTLKRNHVIAHSWRGHDSTVIPIEEYLNNFSAGEGPAQLLVSGDWAGITKDGTPLDFIAPATYIFEYLPAGSPVPSGYEIDAKNPIDDLEYIIEDSFGGDQNGVNVAPKDFASIKGDNSQYAQDTRQGVLRRFIDPSIEPLELESYLKERLDEIYSITSDVDYFDVDPEDDFFDPGYARLARENKPFKRKMIFTTK